MVQQQVIAPPPVAPPPVLPPPTGIPPILAPAAKVAPWIIPLVIPGGLLNPLPTANDQIDPRTGRNRFENQTEQPQPNSVPPVPRRHPRQTCENSVLDQLQEKMHNVCNKIPGESCSPSKVSKKKLDKRPCSKIRERIRAVQECMRLRQLIQDKCFGGIPDEVHEKPINELRSGLQHCLALEKVNCTPGHPMADK